MIAPIVLLVGIAFVAAIILGIAAKVFVVEEDPRIEAVTDLLPGANCGGCGQAGCSSAAEAMVKGKIEVNSCVVGGSETAEAIGAFLGYDVTGAEPTLACATCEGGYRAARKFHYSGLQDCRAALQLYHGYIRCENGCLGLGSCMRACRFSAIRLNPDSGLPIFDPERCVGCGSCVAACPKGIISLVGEKTKILHWNQYTQCLSPCRQRCPAQINIPKYLAHARRGEYGAALMTVKDRNPLPTATGRVCPELCATECRRTTQDDPLAINAIKRFVADWERTSGKRLQVPIAADTGFKIAIVGGGPSGLTAAYYLRRLGHEVEIFEMMPKLGGMPFYGIPDYRLSEEQYQWDIDGVLELGVKAHTGVKLGRDITIRSLKAVGFDAVYLAIGCWFGRLLPLEGKELNGIYSGIQYLRRFHTAEEIIKGKRVVVIGAGNVAMDCARSALRIGAESVLLIFRFSRDMMEANAHEIHDAETEGVIMRCLVSPVRFVGENGQLTGIEVQEVTLRDSAGGMPEVLPVEGSDEILDCDVVIQAVGQACNLDGIIEADGLEKTRYHTIQANEETLETNLPGVFAGGDCYTGPRLLVEAIAGGRFAARSIHYYVTEGKIPPIEDRQREMMAPALVDSLVNVIPTPTKAIKPMIPLAERMGTFSEVERTITEEQCQKEASRCLNCGIYCYDQSDLPQDQLRIAKSCPNEPHIVEKKETAPAA
ncbi:FAD-dependent oxidoreductase [Desulfopila aestuarii]|uniref:Ion-translocating oxidoreductase complex subunit B n=1 Tax=Desulfopila aestuarii DSM 18488 TaxID=1121416 RepID=A0A1M7Y5R4_9BACT|nr:FAD-dependent oxidoreductase [Desulfopila aestuarii]SHO47874.1 electron transport complex, RnfABCDGE type, B subunit [Desulfopila aestuarii DSM 18488]